jgi:hypothetical protein
MRSSLQSRKNVVTGMGSGNVENQRMAGAENPQESADRAASRLTEEEIEDRRRKRMEIEDGFLQGFPEQEIEDESIESLHNEYVEWREEKIDSDIQDEYYIQKISPDDPLYNPMSDISRKARIEDTLEAISFDDMIFKGYSDQDIQVRNNFLITLRTITTQQSLWIEQELASLSEESMQYGRHYFSLRQLSCSLQYVNGKSIGTNLHQFKKSSDKKDFLKHLQSRFEFVTNLPQEITDDLIVQFVWFSGRVRKCLAGDIGKKLGN